MTTNEIIIQTLIEQGIGENTANSESIATQINKKTLELKRTFFGKRITPKIEAFFMASEGDWQHDVTSSGMARTKGLLAEIIGLWVAYEYLQDVIPTAPKQSGSKNTDMSINKSSYPRKFEIGRRIYEIQKDLESFLSDYQEIVYTSDCTVLDDQIQFTSPQLLAVGDIVNVFEQAFTVLSEDSLGAVYTLDGTPDPDSNYAYYQIDLTQFAYPKNLPRTFLTGIY